MTTDLSVCRDALDRDPVLYLDLTEAVRRGDGRVLGAAPHGALVAFTNLRDGPDYGYTMFADDERTAQSLCALFPPNPGFITVHERLYFDLLQERFGFTEINACWQVGYLRAPPFPCRSCARRCGRWSPPTCPPSAPTIRWRTRNTLAGSSTGAR